MRFEIKLEDLSKVNPTISVVLRRNKLEKIRAKILKQHKSINNFSKMAGCSQQFLSCIIAGKQSLRLSLAQKISNILKFRLEEIIEKVISRSKPNGCFIPVEAFPIKMTSELASLVGHSFCDGHVGKKFSFTNKSSHLINNTKQKVQTLPIKNIAINERFHKAVTVRFSSLVKDIFIVAGAPKGNKVKQPFQIPPWIKEGTLEHKRNFLQALFDDESTVQVKSREIILHFHKIVSLIDNLHQFLEEVKSLLNDFEVKEATITECHLHEGKNGKTLQKRLRICGTFNFINFQENIGFIHPNKKELLKEMIENTQRLQLRIGEAKRLIINLLNSHTQLNTREIANKLKLSYWCTWNHLKDLEKQNKVVRNRPLLPFQSHLWSSLNNKN